MNRSGPSAILLRVMPRHRTRRIRKGPGAGWVLCLLGSLLVTGGRAFADPPTAPRSDTLAARFAPPAGYRRFEAPSRSLAAWLRALPMKPPGSPVRTREGRIWVEGAHPGLAAVVDLDVLPWQQCWDTAVRLWAEWRWETGRRTEIAFPYGGGLRRLRWRDWAHGLRPVREGRRFTLRPVAPPARGRRAFLAYLRHLFLRTGTVHAHLLQRVAPADVRPGDVLVHPGSPGHAVIVLDVARGPGGEAAVLLGEGFIPAQDLHVLAIAGPLSPWAPVGKETDSVPTPFYGAMRWSELRRFR